MMPLAGGVFLGVVKLRNSMITFGSSPASSASAQASYLTNQQATTLRRENAIALGLGAVGES
jgi:hypothetical protein